MDEKTREMLERLFETFAAYNIDTLRLIECVIQCVLEQKLREGDE